MGVSPACLVPVPAGQLPYGSMVGGRWGSRGLAQHPFRTSRGTDRNPPTETLGCWKPVGGESGAAYRRTSGVQTGVSLSGSYAISTAV